MIFERFLQQVAESQHLNWGETIFAHQDVAQVLKVPAAMLRYTGTDQIPFDVFSRFENSFEIIQTALSSASTPDPDNINAMDKANTDQTSADYLFLSACFLVEQLFDPFYVVRLKEFTPEHCQRMAGFIAAVNNYEHANYPPTRIQENWEEFWSDTGLPKEPRFDCRPSPAMRSYIRWKDIPLWSKSISPPHPLIDIYTHSVPQTNCA